MARHGEKATESHRAVDRASCLRTHRVGVYRRSSRPLTQCTSSLVPASPSLGCAHPRSKRGPTSFAYFVVRRRRGRDLIGPLIAGCLFVNEGTEGDGGVVDHFIAIRLGPRSRGQCEQRVAQLPALRIQWRRRPPLRLRDEQDRGLRPRRKRERAPHLYWTGGRSARGRQFRRLAGVYDQGFAGCRSRSRREVAGNGSSPRHRQADHLRRSSAVPV